MISVLTTNVFPDRRGLDILAKCLGSQTNDNFEWIIIDGFYEANRNAIADQCQHYGVQNVIHTPMCGGVHVPRRFHWELYNNALLLASNDIFVRMGVFRWFAPTTIEIVTNLSSQGAFVDFFQHHSEIDANDYLSLSSGKINERERMKPREVEVKDRMVCHAGMFSYSKEQMLSINGNNEAAELLVHHEDADLNSRWSRGKDVDVRVYEGCMMRIHHNKKAVDWIPQLDEDASLPCNSKRCIAASPTLYRIEENFPDEAERFWHNDFEWCRCPDCGTISPINADKYLEHILDWPIAPIGVDGRVGRDIRKMRPDIDALGALSDKVNLLVNSHTDTRYLSK